MQVDTASILRILAHELRAPAGVAQGYIRMALEGRLPDPAEQRQILEHARDAIGRIGALGREASDVAYWMERSTASSQWRTLTVRTLLSTTTDRLGQDRVDVVLPPLDEALVVRTFDDIALTTALSSLVGAAAREAPGTRPTLKGAFHDGVDSGASHHLDVALGPADSLADLFLGPSAAGAGSVSLERGGLGLSLVIGMLVLDAHGVVVWTKHDQRGTLGVRFPIERTGHAS